METGTRVVSAALKEQGQRGVVVEKQPGKMLGPRLHVRFDDGSDAWYSERDKVVFPEDSAEAAAVLARYAETLGEADLTADVEYARAVIAANRTLEARQAIDRVFRHDSPLAVSAMLELVEYGLSKRMGKPPGWLPAAALRLPSVPGDPIPPTLVKLREWFADPERRPYCGMVSRVFGPAFDPRLLDVLRELCTEAPDPGLVAVRILANDESAYRELAQLRIVEREGELEFDVGDLTPEVASRVLEAGGERSLQQLNLVRQGTAAFDAINLQAWLAWPELTRFKRLNLSEAFRGKSGAEALAKCEALGELEVLDVSACDIGQGGSRVLGKAKNLTSLRELRIDAGDYDRSKWTARSLQALFPKKGGTLSNLERLHIRAWDVSPADLVALKAPGKRPHSKRCTSRKRP